MDEDDGTYTCEAVIVPQAPQDQFVIGITSTSARDIGVQGGS